MNFKNTLLATFLVMATALSFAFAPAKPVVQTPNLPVAEHYTGGQDSLMAQMHRKIQYPALAKRNRVMGQCIIGFVLNEDGSTSNYKILKDAGAGTGQEALRVVKLLKFNAPGYAQQYSVPVNFKL